MIFVTFTLPASSTLTVNWLSPRSIGPTNSNEAASSTVKCVIDVLGDRRSTALVAPSICITPFATIATGAFELTSSSVPLAESI